MIQALVIIVGLALSLPVLAADEYAVHSFRKKQITEHFWAEGANFGDFNRDGRMDIVSGPFWYEGPDFDKRHEYSPATEAFQLKQKDGSTRTVPGFEGALGIENSYSKNFSAFTHDFNADGWTDVFIVGFPGEDSWWFENPRGKEGHWTRHTAVDVTDNESPVLADLTGDGKPELLFHTTIKQGTNSTAFLGYATPDWKRPTEKWTFHKISPPGKWQRYTHGFGYGDVNGDGRSDILEKDGWWEQPASLAGDPVWQQHAYPFAPGQGGAQMYVYDVNGDGRNDVITSLAAHEYGLAWYENIQNPTGVDFKRHVIMNKEPGENKYGVHFSQPHALALADIDGDGLKDIVTGKRFWAHGPKGDAEPNAPAVLYWFRLVRAAGGGGVDYVPYLIDDNSGVGTQVVAGDINGDSHPDIVVGNKRGVFVFWHEPKKASRDEWERQQPKPYKVATQGGGK